MEVKFTMNRTRYYVEALFARGIENNRMEPAVSYTTENKYGVRNDGDVIFEKNHTFYKFYFILKADFDEKYLEERCKTKAKFYYLEYINYCFTLTCDEQRRLHLRFAKRKECFDKDDDVVYLITHYNGSTNEPLKVVKFEHLTREMSRLNKTYVSTIAHPLNFVSFHTAIDF